MAGASGVDESQFKGFHKHFNSFTNYGRRNVSMATYACVGMIAAYFILRKKPSPKPAA